MRCGFWSLFMCGLSVLGLTGCTGLMTNTFLAYGAEKSVISKFIDNLEKSNIEELKEVSSTDFKGSALRHAKAVEAFKMLNLPDGKVEVVEVKETGPDTKRVLVKVGERQRKLYFDLALDSKTKKWVVSDVEFKRTLKPGQVNKSVTEQMDLLLSIQEFLDAWESGDRTEILATSTPTLRTALEGLPPQSLKKFTASITADLKRDSVKPEVEGHANMALVKINRKVGEMLVTMRMIDDKWLADDIAATSKKEEGAIPSLRKQSQVLLTAIRFCDAYKTGNKTELAAACDPKFFKRLANADLSRIPLPIKQADQEDFDIKLLSTRAEVLVKRPDQILQLSLSQGAPKTDEEGNSVLAEGDSGKPYLVEEVTFHEIASKQDKRLSAMFSSRSVVMNFSMGLANADLKSLRFESTTDFQTRVWSRIDLDDLADLPLDQIEAVQPVILDTVFKGPMTEVTVNQGSTPLTYVLRDQNGRLLVDDVLTPALDRPNSLKQNLEVQIPLRNFAKGLKTGDMRLVRDNASKEFNKLVFLSMNRLPKLRSDPAPFLVPPVNKVDLTSERGLLTLGDDHFGAKVRMNKEGDHYVIDDITMVNGPELSQRMGLKQSLRQMVLNGTRLANAEARNPIASSSLEDEGKVETPTVLRSERPGSRPNESQMDSDIDLVSAEEFAADVDPRSTRKAPPTQRREPARGLKAGSGRGVRRTADRERDLESELVEELSPAGEGDSDLDHDAPVSVRPRRSASSRGNSPLLNMVGNQPRILSGDASFGQRDDDDRVPGYHKGDDIDVIQPPRQ